MIFELFKRAAFLSFVSVLLLTLVRIQITVPVIAFPELPILGFFTENITIDGVFEEWTDITNYIDDPANDTLDPYNETLAVSDIIKVKMANNLTHIFWKVDFSGQLSPNSTLPYWSIQLYSEDIAHLNPTMQTPCYPDLSLDFNASFLVSKWSDGGYVLKWGSGWSYNKDYISWSEGYYQGNTTWYAWSGNSIELTFPISDLSSGTPPTNGTKIEMQIVSAFCQTYPNFKSEDKSVHFTYVISPKTINVPTDYPTIQEAINAANPGDIIFVSSGTYYENVIVNKTVSLIGENKETTIIDGNYSIQGFCVKVTVDGVNIEGFTVENCFSGIWLVNSSYATITNMVIKGFKGIATSSDPRDHQNYNIIRNNIIWGVYNGFAYGDVGIHLAWSKNNTIENNTVLRFNEGIYLAGSSDNKVVDNRIVNNRDYGIRIEQSRNLIQNNSISECNNGIWISSNDAVSQDNLIINNKINCNNGIRMTASNNTIIENIVSESSQYAIRLEKHIWSDIYAQYNRIFHNNFINNVNQVYLENATFVNFWDNSYPTGGNYWSDYNGTDLYCSPYQNVTGSDGIGDMPYIVDQNNTDHYPLMKPWGTLQFIHLETMFVYQVHSDVCTNFSAGYYLITEFYSYNEIYQGSVTIWYGTTPADVVLSMDISHPQGKCIEKVYLILRDINLNKIQTITSFTMTRRDLFERITYLDFRWPYVSPDERSAIMNEITDIDIQWIYAPS